MEAIQVYFTGEKETAYYLFPVGMILSLLAIYQLIWLKNQLTVFWIILLVTAILQMGIAAALLVNSPKQLAAAQIQYARDASLFKKKEHQRIIKTLQTFNYIKWTWFLLITLALISYLLGGEGSTKYVFYALGLQAFIMLFFDMSAMNRMLLYQSNL